MSMVANHVNPPGSIPPLEAGDRLTREEFERRYHAMPEVKKAELIEGVVYMPSPVSQARHGGPHARIVTWLGCYRAHTLGVGCGDNSTVRLDLDNEPQPDAVLRIEPGHGGQSQDTVDGYIAGAPELVVEVAASSVSYDLHDKKNAYRRNGVCEYVVWRVGDRAIDWFVLRGGDYVSLAPAGGVLRSERFPGLWLAAPALVADDMLTVLGRLGEGLATAEHSAFIARLRAAGPRGP
jgi:Uma2 family endonuclease